MRVECSFDKEEEAVALIQGECQVTDETKQRQCRSCLYQVVASS